MNSACLYPLLIALLFFSIISRGIEASNEFSIKTSAPENRELKFSLREPRGAAKKYPRRILVLFGGRNWPGNRTMNVYKMAELADKYNLVLLSPWFKNDEYWSPEKWSGKALFEAFDLICKKYQVSPKRKVLYYGYSAGGQCANLFYAWHPERVLAWGVHACGVWKMPGSGKYPVPGLVTCGRQDEQRYLLSQLWVRNMRESGIPVIWLGVPGGHGLPKEVLHLARVFFASVLDGGKICYAADDQSGRVVAIDTPAAKHIDPAYRNTFFNKKAADTWSSLITD